MNAAKRLVIGTVQFGLTYGISHSGDRVTPDEANRILSTAWNSGVRCLDTAAVYGNSEEVIGSLPEARRFTVISKTLPLRQADTGLAAVEAAMQASLTKLGRSAIDTLLVHDAADLRGPNGRALWSLLEEFRKRDCVRRIGASVYSPYEAEDLLEAYPLDVVQLPLNVFDQRAVEGGTLQRLAQVGVAVHARSLLLQGLLLMDPGTVPVGMGRFIPRLRRWHEACASAGSSPLAAALSFAAEQPIEGLVVGVQSRAQLVECLAALERQVQLKWSSFSSADADLIDPRKWSV